MARKGVIADNPAVEPGKFTIRGQPVELIATQEGIRKIKFWKNRTTYYYRAGMEYYYNRSLNSPFWRPVINNLIFWRHPTESGSKAFFNRNNIYLIPQKATNLRCQMVEKEGSDAEFSIVDENGNLEVEQVDLGQAKWPYKWPKKHLTWKLLNSTNDTKAKWVEYSVKEAFRAIEDHTKLKFTMERNPNKKTDITIRFTEDLSVFDGKKSVLAHAYLYHPNGTKNGILEFNDFHIWTPHGEPLTAVEYTELTGNQVENPNNTFKTIPLIHVLIHEIIHMLGYRHDMKSKFAQMWPYAKAGFIRVAGKLVINVQAFILHPRDITRLGNGYGRKILPPFLLSRKRIRRIMGYQFR